MANRESAYIEITPEVLLKAYACGIFPMAESAEDPSLYWIEPDLRGIRQMDRHAHDGIIRNAVGAAQLPGQMDHRMTAKLAKLILGVLGVRLHLRRVVLGVASQPEDQAQQLHSGIDADSQPRN